MPAVPDDRQLDEWLGFAHGLADAAHALLAPAAALRPEVQVKADRSFVTALDAQIEQRLRELIGQRYPHHGILGEEAGAAALDAEAVWILDPIDGTAPFVAGVPVFGTLIALAWRGVPVIGLMHLPVTGQRYVGVAGRASTLNGTPLRTRACPSLGAAILTTSNPDFLSDGERPAFEALRQRTAWRIYGGCCLSYGLLAAGRTDVAIDAGFKIYDYAPFRPLIEGAGGTVTDWQGRPVMLASGSQVLAAGDAARHREALHLIEASLA
ncbi:MAG: inositol monophosphatase [Rubrivivax sp.]|nr:inositol monophosphatase [Rubrivivax sp.]